MRVELVENLGSDKFAYGVPVNETEGTTVRGRRVTVRLPKGVGVAPGEHLAVRPVLEEAHAFDSETGASLHLG